MGAFNNTRTLLSITDATNENQTGTARSVIDNQDDVPSSSQEFKAWFEVEIIDGTDPTWDAVVETSPDGVHWATVATATQRTGVGTFAEIKDISTVTSRIRARVVVGGTAAPNWTGTIKLLSSGGFRLITSG